MRAAIVSDIHGNLRALEAVLADLRKSSPDVVLHGGDLADSGSSPVEVLDRIRALGWQGVVGNTDEMLFRPESLTEFATQTPGFRPLLPVVEEMAAAAREALGSERLEWLRGLPQSQVLENVALVHASPPSCWRSPTPEAKDEELASVYGHLACRVVVYGHIHRPFVREINGTTVVNSGSAGMPHDGDQRACYVLLDHGRPQVRRVEYDVDRELKALACCARPHSDWVAKIVATARPQLP